MPTISLFGGVTLNPLVNTSYDLTVNQGTFLESTNEVRLFVDTTTATSTLNLPPISNYNGIFNTLIFVIDTGANASGENITINCDPSDLICNGAGSNSSIVINQDDAIVVLEIASANRWMIYGI
jgi:hypothetical protein